MFGDLSADLSKSTTDVMQQLGEHVPNIVGAMAILAIGWLVALLIASVVGSLLKKTPLNDYFAKAIGGANDTKVDIITPFKTIIFYFLMLFVLVGFFQVLGLTLITEPLNEMLNQIFAYLPRLLAATTLAVTAWVLATLLKKAVVTGLQVAKLDEKIKSQADGHDLPMSVSLTLSETVYWVVFLLFLPSVLNALSLESILGPVRTMFDKFLGFIPNVASCAVIIPVGWFVAQIVQKIVSNVLAASGADSLSDKVGLSTVMGENRLSGMVGTLVYIFVLFPAVIAALDVLNIEVISKPATNMLNQIMQAIPVILAAFVVVIIAYTVGKLASTMVRNLLQSIGFDNVCGWLGLQAGKSTQTPSTIAGHIVLVAIILYASMESFNMLGFVGIGGLIEQFIVFATHLLVSLLIFAAGLLLANLAAKTVETSGTAQAHLLALAARVAIYALSAAMALEQSGLAPDIVNMAFAIIFGALALGAAAAIGIAFGLGGKPVVEREMDNWISMLK